MSAESKDRRGQAFYVLKSYLMSVGIEAFTTKTYISITSKDQTSSLIVHTGTGAGLALDVDAILSADLKRIIDAFQIVTEAAGYGKLNPVDRGEAPGSRIDYHDNYELSYLRHQIFRRTPDPKDMSKIEELVPHIRNAAQRVLYRSNALQEMGHTEEDLINIGRLHAMVFLHNYAYKNDVNQIAPFVEFINQRFRQFSEITALKRLNVTTTIIPQFLRNDEVMCADGLEPMADEEYEDGEYQLISRSGVTSKLVVKNDGFLGLDLYVDDRKLTKREIDVFRTRVAAGDYSLMGTGVADNEPASRAATRQQKAREELYTRFESMDDENRELTLAYAAMADSYAPDARDVARDLCDELICPKCQKRVMVGLKCKLCSEVAVPRFGVDYVAVRNRLRESNDSLANVMVAPLPRKKQFKKVENVKYSRTKKLTTAPVVPVSYDEIRQKDEELKAACFESLPESLTCCTCKQCKPKSKFGVRIPKRKPNGMPALAAKYPRCLDCRNG